MSPFLPSLKVSDQSIICGKDDVGGVELILERLAFHAMIFDPMHRSIQVPMVLSAWFIPPAANPLVHLMYPLVDQY
jgi:hypothetical protein